MKQNERNYKRFSFKNALIRFFEEENLWEEIADLSRRGFKLFGLQQHNTVQFVAAFWK